MRYFGLIGYPLRVSFSRKFFTEFFQKEKIAAQYDLYPLETIKDFPALLQKQRLSGLNVTIPYKELVLPFLDELDETAAAIAAVNVIKFMELHGEIRLKGYNTDLIGFVDSIKTSLKKHHTKALILGTGGASKAVDYGLKTLGLETRFVSRSGNEDAYSYADLNETIMQEYTVIVNTTPLGMSPNVDACPDIPYEFLTENHLLYDVIYTPEETLFLSKGKAQHSVIVNGLQMLHRQAEAAWRIWNEKY